MSVDFRAETVYGFKLTPHELSLILPKMSPTEVDEYVHYCDHYNTMETQETVLGIVCGTAEGEPEPIEMGQISEEVFDAISHLYITYVRDVKAIDTAKLYLLLVVS